MQQFNSDHAELFKYCPLEFVQSAQWRWVCRCVCVLFVADLLVTWKLATPLSPLILPPFTWLCLNWERKGDKQEEQKKKAAAWKGICREKVKNEEKQTNLTSLYEWGVVLTWENASSAATAPNHLDLINVCLCPLPVFTILSVGSCYGQWQYVTVSMHYSLCWCHPAICFKMYMTCSFALTLS